MLSPDNANPNHQFDQLPPQLQDMVQVEALPLLNPIESTPLVRHEWTRMDKIKFGFCTLAAGVAIAHMSEGLAENALDALRGHSETTTTQQDERRQVPIQDNGTTNRVDPPDLFEFEQQISGTGERPEPFKPNIPRHKLPFPINENTKAPKNKVETGKQ